MKSKEFLHFDSSYATADRFEIEWYGERLTLFASGALFHHETRSLLVADLHLGRACSFEHAGLHIPRLAEEEDWQKVLQLVDRCRPDKLYVLGDLCHHVPTFQKEWEQKWASQFTLDCPMILVEGNHDRGLVSKNTSFHHEKLVFLNDSVCLVHDAADAPQKEEQLVISGHIHPAFCLPLAYGREKRPCFWFDERVCVLPAMSQYAGGVQVGRSRAKDLEHFFLLYEDKLVSYPFPLSHYNHGISAPKNGPSSFS